MRADEAMIPIVSNYLIMLPLIDKVILIKGRLPAHWFNTEIISIKWSDVAIFV